MKLISNNKTTLLFVILQGFFKHSMDKSPELNSKIILNVTDYRLSITKKQIQ